MEAFTERKKEIYDHPAPPTVLIGHLGVHFVHKSHHPQRLLDIVLTSPLSLDIVPIQADFFL